MTHPAAAREIVDQVVKDVLADFTTGPGGYTLSFRDGAWTDAIATALATAEAAGWRAGVEGAAKVVEGYAKTMPEFRAGIATKIRALTPPESA